MITHTRTRAYICYVNVSDVAPCCTGAEQQEDFILQDFLVFAASFVPPTHFY